MAFFEFPHTRNYDSDLGWLIRQCKTNQDAIAALEAWKADTQSDIDDIKQLYADIIAGRFPQEMADAITEWIAANFYDIVAEMMKMVFFGLTDSGYFVAYIPESWNDITFNTTGYDIEVPIMPDFGHLVLSY